MRGRLRLQAKYDLQRDSVHRRDHNPVHPVGSLLFHSALLRGAQVQAHVHCHRALQGLLVETEGEETRGK